MPQQKAGFLRSYTGVTLSLEPVNSLPHRPHWVPYMPPAATTELMPVPSERVLPRALTLVP